MKKNFKLGILVIMCSLVFTNQSCTSLDDVNNRIDQVENDVNNLKAAIKLLQQAHDEGKMVKSVMPITTSTGDNGGWIITFSDNSTITVYNGFQDIEKSDGFVNFTMIDGQTFMFKTFTPRLTSLGFLASANPNSLIDDVYGEIIGDSVVECWARYIMDSKVLIPHFTFEGDEITVGDDVLTSDTTPYDFKAPVKITVKSGDQTKDYNVYMHAFTGIPVLWINTEGKKDITSKEEYLRASFRLVEDVKTRAAGEIIEDSVNIKGRGNATWTAYPKKPFNLKFDKKKSLLGMPEDKSWVLLANYADKTYMRNHIAFFMGYLSKLNYTTKSHFVEVMLNGRYNGVYELCEKIKISKKRVNVGNDGFLMEIDAYAPSENDSRYFSIKHLNQAVNIKDPEVEYNDENFCYAKDFVSIADSILYSDNYKDPNEGWQKYLDIDSFVDWMLINEIAKNLDSFWWSGYFSLKRGDKLRMEPLWDFDHSFGNYVRDGIEKPSGWAVRHYSWYSRLFSDPTFVEAAKKRFDYFYEKKDEIIREINETAQYLNLSSVEDNNKWGILYRNIGTDNDIWGNYQNEVQSMKLWIQKRFEWLKEQFDAM